MFKSDFAKDLVTRYLDGRGPVKLDDLIKMVWELTDDGDPRWIGVALMNLNREGRIRYATTDGKACDGNHNHDDTCTVELISASAA